MMNMKLIVPLFLVVAMAGAGCARSSAPAPSTLSPTTGPAAGSPTRQPEPSVGRSVVAPAPAGTPTSPAPKVAWDELSFDQITTIADQRSEIGWAIKQGKIRMEVLADGQRTVVIADPVRKTGYMWSPGQNLAVQIPYDQADEHTSGRPDPAEISNDARLGAPVGNETIDSQVCEVYEVGGSTAAVKTWLAKSNGFPLKFELRTPDVTTTTEFKNIKIGGVSDSLFQPPAGAQLAEPGAALPTSGPR